MVCVEQQKVPTEDQIFAIDTVKDWFFNRPTVRCASLAGLAGTGKTTITSLLLRELTDSGHRCLSSAPTGRAASVLRRKGLPANTLCSMLYRYAGTYLDAEGKEQIRLRDRDWYHDCDLLVVDEASMVDTKTFYDLMQKEVRVLFVGDHGQLRPVGGDPRIMENPTVKLEKNHRQLDGSMILKAAYWARQDRSLPLGESDDLSIVTIDSVEEAVERAKEDQADCIITGKNRTRYAVNRIMRRNAGYLDREPPQPGEPLLCRNNERERDVYNGEVYRVVENLGTYSRYHVVTLSDEIRGVLPGEFRIYRPALEEPESALKMDMFRGESFFEWGYGMTCHSMQGSEAPRGFVVDEPFGDVPAWRYTAFTRFSRRLVVGRQGLRWRDV